MATGNSLKRGALIVLEGCDRSGKSTQARKLVDALKKRNIWAEMMSFPDRSTATGKLISEYLTSKTELSDRAIHLLFSANRWEVATKMQRMLEDGITLIVDRYAYSGVAFSAVKQNMDIHWCKQPDAGLPRPDLVFLLTLSSEALAKRPGYGNERYEQESTQKKVLDLYMKMKDDSWVVIDADDSVEQVYKVLLDRVLKVVDEVRGSRIDKLW